MSNARTAIVLAGHGSHISPETAGLVWDVADRIRAMGVVHEVAAAFWKEQPSFHDVLRSIEADDITVIPVFTARGFFTQEVIPAEMGLTGPITYRDGKTIRYTKTLSETPFLNEVVLKRVRDAMTRTKGICRDIVTMKPQECAVAIIGHSTKRNPESRKAAEACVQFISDNIELKEVVAVFLDDDPPIKAAFSLTTAPLLIAIPLFIAAGSHVTIDVRSELGLREHQNQRAFAYLSRELVMTDPAGVDPTLIDALLNLAKDAGVPLRPPATRLSTTGFPAAGCSELWETVTEKGAMRFGQLHLTPTQIDMPADDVSMKLPDERIRVTKAGFRPLASARTLPPKTTPLYIRHATDLHYFVESVYPGAVADWALARQGKFIPNTFEACIGRQVGQFKQLEGLAQEKRADLVSRICGRCIKHPSWFDGEIGDIPCAEPCNFWLSAALREHTGDE